MKPLVFTIACILHASATLAAWIAAPFVAFVRAFRLVRDSRTNADKRRSVEIALREFGNLSDVEISKVCAVSPRTVEAHRKNNSATCGVEARLGADGKIRKVPTMRHEPRGEVERTKEQIEAAAQRRQAKINELEGRILSGTGTAADVQSLNALLR